MNSRHPGPRRVRKVGSPRRPLPPLPRVTRVSRDCSKAAIPLQTSIKKIALGAHWTSNFQGFSRKEPRGTPRRPKEPKGAPRHPKKSQRQHQGGTKGAQWRPRGTQRSSLAPQREFKGGLYTQKLPINRTSGRYVMIYKIR